MLNISHTFFFKRLAIISVVLAMVLGFMMLFPRITHATNSIGITFDNNSCYSSNEHVFGHTCTLKDVSSACKQVANPQCSTDDQQILSVIAGCGANQSFLGAFVGGNYTLICNDDQKAQAAEAATYLSVTCSGAGFWAFPTKCIGRSLSSIIGSALITVSAWLLALAGSIFDWLVYYTIIVFGSADGVIMTSSVVKAINVGWSLFRDISNIVIIGLFTFIAIATILGLKEYGYKKLVARVLIIAVLINFSLLFTKLIIDGSNFTAYQFYNAEGLNATTATQSGVSSPITQSTQTGIAGTFLTYMGVSGFSETYDALSNGADAVQNGWLVLLHGLFSATMLLGAALVLLYGSFLLVTRAITIILLMLTASIAFATHLVPAFDKKGWSLWWESLIKAAVFAPVLMIFLWISSSLAKGLQPPGGSLGALTINPTGSGDLGSLFGYIMILGLLYASFKISSSFASMAGSMNFSGLATAGLAAATGGVTGFALRNSVGRLANATNERMMAGAKNLSREGNGALARGIGRTLYSGAQPFKAAAGSKSFGDFSGNIKRKGEAYGKMSADLKLSKEEKEKIRGEADQKTMNANPHLKEAHTNATADVQTAKSTESSAKNDPNVQKALAESAKEITDLKARHEEALRAAASDPNNTDKRMAAEGANHRLQQRIAGQEQIIRDQDARIASAQTALSEATAAHAKVSADIRKITDRSGVIKANLDQSDGSLAGQLAHGRFTNTLKGLVGMKPDMDNDRVVQATKKYVDDHHKSENRKKAAESFGEKADKGAEKPAGGGAAGGAGAAGAAGGGANDGHTAGDGH